jgi:hypothetical protein
MSEEDGTDNGGNSKVFLLGSTIFLIALLLAVNCTL